MPSFTDDQVQHLLKPIVKTRVLSDGKGHSHVSQQDITAHLIRMFGFGNFDIEVMDVALVFETERVNDKGVLSNRFDVCYRALVRLTVRNPDGEQVATYENGSTATAQNQSRGDGHDLAYKSAISLSIKRAAIALGDQFGLSLYNKGQLTPLVIATLVGSTPVEDLQKDIPQQVSLGNDEIDHTPEPVKPPEAWRTRVAAAKDMADLSEIHAEAADNGWATPDLMAALTARKKALGA
jgi:recombination DNA repair RAD52 pathway protein